MGPYQEPHHLQTGTLSLPQFYFISLNFFFLNHLLDFQVEVSRVQEPGKRSPAYSKLGSSCSSICSFRDVVHGNAKVVHRADNSPESSSVGQETRLLTRKSANGSSSRSLTAPTPARTKNGGSGSASYNSSSSRGIQLRKLSGCYECHTIVDPSRYIFSHSTNHLFMLFLILFFPNNIM